MSRSQKPRRPQYFSRMKYRARKRHQPRWVVCVYRGVRWSGTVCMAEVAK